MIIRAGLIFLALCGDAWAQGGSGFGQPPRNQPQYLYRATDSGAKCDGVTDDSAAINAAINLIRTARQPITGENYETPIGISSKFVLGGPVCLISHSINMTAIYGSGFVADFTGSVILCQTNGTPCVDATGIGQVGVLGLNIYGNMKNPPNVGLAIGLITNDGVGADHNTIDHPVIAGYFTLAPYFNNQSETTIVTNAAFFNGSPSAYGAIFDGDNHFNFQSAFTGKKFPQNTHQSFNENTCLQCEIITYGAGSVPIWIGGGTNRHRFVNSYVAANNTLSSARGPEVVLHFGNGSQHTLLDLDIHFEDGSKNGLGNVTSILQFQGTGGISLNGLHLRDNAMQQSGPIFSRGPGVTTVNIGNANLEIILLSGVSPSWWDAPANYTVSGYIYNRDNSYTAPGAFTGMLCGLSSCSIK